jgi:hypothetical protein
MDRETADRLRAKLADPHATFTRDQVAWLMGEAARWAAEAVEDANPTLTWQAGFDAGYRQAQAEENAAYPPAPIVIGTTWIDQVDRRRRADEEAARRRPKYRGNYQPAPLWPPTWCGRMDRETGLPVPHRPHVTTVAGERFRCEGRRA